MDALVQIQTKLDVNLARHARDFGGEAIHPVSEGFDHSPAQQYAGRTYCSSLIGLMICFTRRSISSE